MPNILPHIMSLLMCPSSIRVWHEIFEISGLNLFPLGVLDNYEQPIERWY